MPRLFLPSGPKRLNYASPRAHGLVRYFSPLASSGKTFNDLLRREDATVVNTLPEYSSDEIATMGPSWKNTSDGYWNAGAVRYGIAAFTVTGWVILSSTAGNAAIVTHGEYGKTAGCYINVYSSRLTLTICNGTSQLVDSSNFPTDEPVHFAVVKNGTTAWIYRNGVQTATGSVNAGNDSVTNLYLGAYPYTYGPQYWVGNIGEIGIYERALSATEIMELYTAPVDAFYEIDKSRYIRLIILPLPATTTVRLAWTDNSEGEDGFSIERKAGTGAYAVVHTTVAGVETWDDTNLPEGETYTYRVRAISAALGDSEYSNEAGVTV